MRALNIAQQAAVGMLMAYAMGDELIDTLDDMGHPLTEIESSASTLAYSIARSFAERVGLTEEQIAHALGAGSNMAEKAMLPLEAITPPSHQLTGKPDRSLN